MLVRMIIPWRSRLNQLAEKKFDISLIDVMDERLRPKPTIKTITHYRMKPCLGEKKYHHFLFDKNGHVCSACKFRLSELESREYESQSNTGGVRGPLTNHEFIALFLLKSGPVHADEVREAYKKFRTCNNVPAGFFVPNGQGMGSTDSHGVYWCGTKADGDSYWWCARNDKLSVAGKKKRKWGGLSLTRRGLDLAALAAAKAWLILELDKKE